MKKYPSIGQFRNVVKEVRMAHDYQGKDASGNPIYKHIYPYPTIKFKGTIKLHGTSAGVLKYTDGSIVYQSREREITPFSDNAGFALAMSNIDLSSLFESLTFNDYIAIYGEWCGSNIQKGVALNNLPKQFVIFDVVVDGVYLINYKLDLKDKGIYNINNFKSYEIDIDFNEPELSQNQIIEWTLEVENECPFAKEFGFSGIGEGIVFKEVGNPSRMFKSKGEKHSSSKVKTLASVDVETLESYKDFVDYACSENRLKQGLENVPSLDVKNTGAFIKWVANDIIKEEVDTLASNQLEWKKVAGLVAKKASEFFRNQTY